LDDEAAGSERQQRKKKIEAHHVRGQKYADAARERHQPAHNESPAVRSALQIL
jgi:hypothetical protein